jgi:lipopolysaccharide biosynthesis protein
MNSIEANVVPAVNQIARLIAFYLPQFHPIPENDLWWGKGFTEWTNVTRAKPRFPGHYQPHLPADLGFYDLRLAEARQAQADLACEYGIHGFCYYHYWFQGRRLLERPFEAVLDSGAPNFPFCLCWANEKWTRTWDGYSKELLIDQHYSVEDDLRHIRWLARAFQDERYIRYQGKPLFLVYRASDLPDPRRTLAVWREEAHRLKIGDLFLCRVESHSQEKTNPDHLGFDGAVEFQPDWDLAGRPLCRGTMWRILTKLRLSARGYQSEKVHSYASWVERSLRKSSADYLRFPCVTPGWDNSARRASGAFILNDSTPELFGYWLKEVIRRSQTCNSQEPMVFINGWNEWAEGNHLEPDLKYGRAYLEATRQALLNQ